MINTTDEWENTTTTCNNSSRFKIPGSRTPLNVPPNQITANAETLQEPPNAKMLPEMKAEPTQVAEHDKPVN